MGDGQGNLIGNKGFQFTIVPAAFIDTGGNWRPEKVEKPEKATNHWIYAIGYKVGEKGKLWGEYHADDKGALTFVSGDRRRATKPADCTSREKIPEAGLPTIVQKKPITYAFVAARGQLSRETIAQMENSLPQIYGSRLGGDFDFNDPQVFVKDSTGQLFLPVVDVLAIGEELNRRYRAERNQAHAYVNGKPGDKSDQAKAEERRKKYQLAKLIKDQLYDPPKGPFDPFQLAHDSLSGQGKDLNDCISLFEGVTRSNDEASSRAARHLIRFLLSPLWELQFNWYWKSDEGHNIGHYWIEASCHSIEQLRETPEGRDFINWAVSTGWLVDCLFMPEQNPNQTPEEADQIEAENNEFFDGYTVVRKAGTAVVTGIGELAPAIIVSGKVRAAAKKRVIDSISLIFSSAEVRGVVRRGGGQVVRKLHAQIEFMQLEIKFKPAKADLKEWVEQGKPHWPESKVAEVAGYVFMLCEAFNFYSYITTLFDTLQNQTANEEDKRKALIGAGGALLDLAVACEDPIRAWARAVDARRAADHAFASGADAAAAGSGEAEAVGLFGRATAPWVFKAMGVASAAIDTYYAFFVEAPEADEAGDRAMARAKRTIGAGSLTILIASIANGAGYLLEAAALTAAASALLVVGVIIVAIGWAMTVYFSRTIWQKFTSHSSFGTEHGSSGVEKWSGGDFSTWTSDAAGFDRQIQVLTAMMCSFKMSGTSLVRGQHGSDWEAISVEFGALPPGAKLELEFDLTYEAGGAYHPRYVLDLETRKCEREGPGEAPDPTCYPEKGGPVKHVVFVADRPSWATNTRVKESSCSVVVRYAPQTNNSEVATGVIPISGPCTFKIYDGIGVDLTEVSSLDFKPKDAEKK